MIDPDYPRACACAKCGAISDPTDGNGCPYCGEAMVSLDAVGTLLCGER